MTRITRVLAGFALFAVVVAGLPSSVDSAEPRIPVTTARSALASLRERDPEFKQCYESHYDKIKRKGRSARINLRIIIDKSGELTEISSVKNTTRVRAISDCVIKVVERIRFDPQRTKRVLIYPIRFKPMTPETPAPAAPKAK